MPHVEMMRFVSSGTEATMSAIRLARAATGRELHSQVRRLLSRPRRCVSRPGWLGGRDARASRFARRAGRARGADAHRAVQRSRRRPRRRAPSTAAASPRSSSSRSSAMRASSRPIRRSFAVFARIADEIGALLIFDEVMTGFRIAPGGARERFGVRADLTTLGKVIGGGLARRGLWRTARPDGDGRPTGPVYQAGTLSGNPLAMAAGIATLRLLTPPLHEKIEPRTARARLGACARSRRGSAFRSPRTARARCSGSSSAPSRCARSPTRARAT